MAKAKTKAEARATRGRRAILLGDAAAGSNIAVKRVGRADGAVTIDYVALSVSVTIRLTPAEARQLAAGLVEVAGAGDD